jgi:hypothetical protein
MAWWIFQNLVFTTALAAVVFGVCLALRPGPAARHALWLLWAAGILIVESIRWLQLRRSSAHALPADPAIAARVTAFAAGMRVGPVRVLTLAGTGSPFIYGVGHPLLLWPAGLTMQSAAPSPIAASMGWWCTSSRTQLDAGRERCVCALRCSFIARACSGDAIAISWNPK